MKKYELTNVTKIIDGVTLHRIKALKSFGNVIAGETGGWVESEKNLSQYGLCWVYDNACVFNKIKIYGNACVYNCIQ